MRHLGPIRRGKCVVWIDGSHHATHALNPHTMHVNASSLEEKKLHGTTRLVRTQQARVGRATALPPRMAAKRVWRVAQFDWEDQEKERGEAKVPLEEVEINA